MSVRGAQQKIHEVVLSWPGVTTGPSRFGGTEYRLGKREIGHIHGDSLVDIRFPREIRDDIVAAGCARPHHILPKSGWISFYINEAEDIDKAIDLLRESFELVEDSPLGPALSKAKGSKPGERDGNKRRGAKRDNA